MTYEKRLDLLSNIPHSLNVTKTLKVLKTTEFEVGDRQLL